MPAEVQTAGANTGVIAKVHDGPVRPNLEDYDADCSAFSWEEARRHAVVRASHLQFRSRSGSPFRIR